MNNSVQSFNFNQNQIQVINKDGEAWFVASEIAAMFGYRDAANLTRILDDDEKGTHNVSTLGGKQDVSVINESGFYHAAFKSRKAEVKPFRKWVTTEVLPAIRKTGSYSGRLKPQAPRQALPSGLTHEQQAEVKALHNILIQSVPFEKQKALAITLWSAVKSKFKVGYKDVPPEQFPEVLSLMARVAVEKGAQYREAETVNLETVPKLFERQANIPFDLQRDAHYAVTVRNGKIYRHSLSYASMPHEDSMIPCLAHQV